jgi:hypothetical protein
MRRPHVLLAHLPAQITVRIGNDPGRPAHCFGLGDASLLAIVDGREQKEQALRLPTGTQQILYDSRRLSPSTSTSTSTSTQPFV